MGASRSRPCVIRVSHDFYFCISLLKQDIASVNEIGFDILWTISSNSLYIERN